MIRYVAVTDEQFVQLDEIIRRKGQDYFTPRNWVIVQAFHAQLLKAFEDQPTTTTEVEL